MTRFALLLLIAVVPHTTLFSQNKLVIDDGTGILTEEVVAMLKTRLEEKDIEYTTVVDFKARCEYYYTELNSDGDNLILQVKDCDHHTVGTKNLGSQILSASTEEKSFLLSYNILDVLDDPLVTDIPGRQEEGTTFEVSNHNTRYFFAPSAYNLKEGELYYNTVYFLLHDVQYGLSDYFSAGIGTSVAGIPLYLTPKISFPVGDKSAFAIGDMLIFGTYGTRALGNLLYGSFSTGGDNGNASLGLGYLATNESDITEKTSSVVFNLSGIARASDHIFLMTENYVFGVNTRSHAYYEQYNQNTDTWIYLNEEYTQKLWFWYGVAGVRIFNRAKDYVSWQIGLTYVIGFPGEIPEQYAHWDTGGWDKIEAIAFPALSYTRKFGKKY